MADLTPTRLLIVLLSSLCVMLAIPSAGFAQGSMDFGVDEVEEDDEDEDIEDEEDGTMSFGEEEVDEDVEDDFGADTTFTVAVVAIPSEAISGDERAELQQRMRQSVSLDPSYEVQDGAAVLDELEMEGLASCITEPLCLSGVGQEVGVERILMGRVEDTARGLVLNIDLFDVTDRLFVRYASEPRLTNFGAVLDAVEPTMKEIFDIRVERQEPNYGDEGDAGTVQKVLAYSTAGLAAVSLGAGIYFGTQASSGEDDILAQRNEEGQFDITQREAQQRVRDVEGDALTANVLYGASAGLAILSGVLFYIDSGSDVAAPDDRRRRRRAGVLERLDLRPQVGFGEVGLGAILSF